MVIWLRKITLYCALICVALGLPQTAIADCPEGPDGKCIQDGTPIPEVASKRRLRAEADLVVGIWAKRLTVDVQVGAVAVFRGQKTTTARPMPLFADQLVERSSSVAQSRDVFGSASALRDFDNDGFEDLIVGISGGRRDDLPDRPGLAVLYSGTSDGFVFRDTITKGTIPGGRPGAFGQSVIAGDFDGDGWQDFAVGSPGHPVGDIIPGGVFVYRNRQTDLSQQTPFLPPFGQRVLRQGMADLDQEGWTLAAADVDLDGRDELIIGAPGVTVNGVEDAGAVFIFGRGTPTGPLLLEARIDLAQLGVAVSASRFGHAITVADFDRDGRPDLAIGAPVLAYGGFEGSEGPGKVYIVRNEVDGFVLAVELSQDGMDETKPFEMFGASLAAGDYNGDSFPELTVGAPQNVTDPPASLRAGVPDTFIIANLRRWRRDERLMRGRQGRLTAADVMRDCFEPRPFANRRPNREPIVRSPRPARRGDAQIPRRDARGGDRVGDRAGDSSNVGGRTRLGGRPDIQVPSLDCTLIIPDLGRQPVLTNISPIRTGRVFLFANNNGTLEPDQLLGGGAPVPIEADAFIGASQKAADFNGDGFSDLVVGAINKTPAGATARSGLAEVFVGSPNGLTYVGELNHATLAPLFDGENFGGSMDQ